MEKILILESRKKYHKLLTDKKVLTISADGIASNADSGNIPSIEISKIIAEKLNAEVGAKLKGQTAGNLFEQITMNFIEETFPKMQHLRPGDWEILNLGNQNKIKT